MKATTQVEPLIAKVKYDTRERATKRYALPNAPYGTPTAKYAFIKQSIEFTLYSDANGTTCKAIYTATLKQLKRKKYKSASPHARHRFQVLNASGGVLQTLDAKNIKILCKDHPVKRVWDFPPEEFDLVVGVNPLFDQSIPSLAC